jgi:hypothetical protein
VLPLLFIVSVSCNEQFAAQKQIEEQESVSEANQIIGNFSNTNPTQRGKISFKSIGDFEYNPGSIETLRKDIFKDGYFSVFDVLIHLDEKDKIDMEYHFDKNLNTHVIDSINGKKHWWYIAYYDGGWSENNVFRIDHFPYKDGMYIRIFPMEEKNINSIYEIFRREIEMKNQNGEKIIVPRVIIRGPQTNLEFTNVEVKPHNLRSDIFQEGIVTAIDIIMSLGDEKKLSYDVKWHDSIGSAEIVRNYFVDRINNDKAYGRCGFVYEAGSEKFGGFRGNHIHLPSDSRVLNSPEYVEYFWICI